MEQIIHLVAHIIQSSSYFGIFTVMLLNSDFVPLFTEATLPFAGFLASQGKLSVSLIITASVLGDLMGGLIAYSIGYFLEEKVILTAIKKYGKFILLKEKDYLKVIALVRKYGGKIVFFAKLTPGLKTYTSVAAGISEIKLKTFILSSVLASLIYNSTLTLLGFYLGKNWAIIGVYVKKIELVIFIILILGTLWVVNHKLKIIKLKRY